MLYDDLTFSVMSCSLIGIARTNNADDPRAPDGHNLYSKIYCFDVEIGNDVEYRMDVKFTYTSVFGSPAVHFVTPTTYARDTA